MLKSLVLLICFALCTKPRPLELFHQYIFTVCVSLKRKRGGVARQAGGQPPPLDNLKANDFFFFPSFSFCPLYCKHEFCQSSDMSPRGASRRGQRSGLAHRFDSSEVKGWLDATCWAKLRPLFTFVLVQRFEFYIWMWWASCNYNKWACTLMFWCNLSLPQIIFLGYIGPINRKKTHLIISRLGSAWILFVLSGVEFEFVTSKKKNTRQFQRKSLYLQTVKVS